MEQHAAKPLLHIVFSCVLLSVSCVFLYNKRRKPIVDCRDDGRLEDVNMNSRGLLCLRPLTSAQYWRLQRRESATWIHQTIFVQFKDRRCSASLQTPFFALSIFPRVQEPAAIRPCGLRVFQTHYQDDKKKYRVPFRRCGIRFGALCGILGIRMVAGGGGEGIFIRPKGYSSVLLMAFRLKKPAYHVEIPFLHNVKVLFQNEILFPHNVKA